MTVSDEFLYSRQQGVAIVTLIAPVEPFATRIKIFDWQNFTLIASLRKLNVLLSSPYSSIASYKLLDYLFKAFLDR